MTLTKAKLLKAAKPRYETVDVEGFGKVGIRSVSRSQQSIRESGLRDPATGEFIPEELARLDVYTLIDQLMISEKESMFDDGDVETLMNADAAVLAPLYMAVNEFNSWGAAKLGNRSGGSKG